ncbi:MAG: D-alanyl-D-alanine carboxypeptidase/D-alanyl-D-alanine-endopeptidase [Bradymonadaceae bacterium]|nr:D-alanyl-D-alanine carboxypeptidase/D-alanyl-D-alanine-endopeptidase [Lujinxingiaceae bacterium]
MIDHFSPLACRISLAVAAALLTTIVMGEPAQAQQIGTASAEGLDSLKSKAYNEQEVARTFDAVVRTIDAALVGPELLGAKIGIHAVDVATGEIVYSRNADVGMNPASNIKLITAAAVLDVLGPQYTFTTHLLAQKTEGGQVKGDLFVKGDGEAFLLFTDVLGWAGQLRQLGITRVDGDLVIDDLYFDGGYMPPGFDQKDSDASYRAPIGAVSVNFNAITLVVDPAKPGEPARIRLDPPNAHVQVVNNARTNKGSQARVNAIARGDAERTVVTVTGTIGELATAVSIRKRIDHPPLFAGEVFKSALEMVGIEVVGTVRTGRAPKDARTLVSHTSQPMGNLVSAMNKWSNNFMAEQLLRVLGSSSATASTWTASLGVAAAFLQRAGMAPGSYSLLNGSGLYDGNTVSARQFVQLLRYMRDHRYAPEFFASLSITGVDGTLSQRLKNTPLAGNMRAKTGTLNHVCTLSGYLYTKSGRLLAYSIMFNDTPQLAWNYRKHQDAIVMALYGAQ